MEWKDARVGHEGSHMASFLSRLFNGVTKLKHQPICTLRSAVCRYVTDGVLELSLLKRCRRGNYEAGTTNAGGRRGRRVGCGGSSEGQQQGTGS